MLFSQKLLVRCIALLCFVYEALWLFNGDADHLPARLVFQALHRGFAGENLQEVKYR